MGNLFIGCFLVVERCQTETEPERFELCPVLVQLPLTAGIGPQTGLFIVDMKYDIIPFLQITGMLCSFQIFFFIERSTELKTSFCGSHKPHSSVICKTHLQSM